MPSAALAVNGADGLEFMPLAPGVLDVRSSLRGRCLDVAGTSGEEGGSFFTTILGGCPDFALAMLSIRRLLQAIVPRSGKGRELTSLARDVSHLARFVAAQLRR
jgi:hypothetical protein